MANIDQEFTARLCPHRGVGKENTIESIASGIALKPFMVEFDVHEFDNALYLGHPPVISTEATLEDALRLFANTTTMPKVDIKLNSGNAKAALQILIYKLAKHGPKKVLVNISGDLDANQYMLAELTLIKNTGEDVLLNIDLGRYAGKNNIEIANHINDLARSPFSVSPNLEDDIQGAIGFSHNQNIPQIHFWSYFDRSYRLEDLYKIMELVLGNGLQVYFDIKTQNIIR